MLKVGMTLTQAQTFADSWTVIDQYNHSELYEITDEFGQPTGEYGSYSNGLSVTLFQDNNGNQVVAVRGTDNLTDWGTNLIDIGLLGTPKYQGQYAALAAQVEQWRHDGVLRSGYSVTGHSLGGFLATHLALDYAAEIEHTYIYNAPGVTGVVSGNLFAGIVNALSPGMPMTFPDVVPISNIVSTTDLVSSVGLSIAPPVTIDIESNLNPIHNHSIVTLTDSLAVYNLFARIDPSLSVSAISVILQASSATANTTLGSAVSGLGQLLVEGFVPRSGNHYDSDRDALYADIQSITTALGEHSGMTIVPLGFTDTNSNFTTLLPYEIETRARTDIAYRYALVNLNPFAVLEDQVAA